MDLQFTDKYFPKTYKYLTDKYGKNQTSANLSKFIKEYSLSGLSLIDPKKAKSVKIMANDVDDSDSKAITAVKKFNDNLQLMDKDYCLIVLPNNSNATAMDSYIYDALKGFVSSHYNISSELLDYIDGDSLVLNGLKNGDLKVVCQRDKSYLVYDIYKPIYEFNYSVHDLSELELAVFNNNHKLLSSINSNTKTKLNKDMSSYNAHIKPILPWLMNDDVSYYNQLIKRGRLLHVLCIAFHV